MNIIKSLLIGLTLLSFAYSTNVTISGTVTDTAGVTIAGAEVSLLNSGLDTTTALDGSFNISGSSAGISIKSGETALYLPVVSIANGMLKLYIHEPSSVNILTYNLQGCLIASMHKTLSVGGHSIALTNRSSGVYLYKVQINNSMYQIMSNSLYNYAISANTKKETSTYSLSKQAKNLTAINDTIRIRKDGYSDCLVPVRTSYMHGITVKMHKALTVTDADGNVYHTIKIGTLIWTVENLRTTHYNDGTAIPSVTDNTAWSDLTTGGYCWYNNDSATYKKWYGALYNWYAVNTGKLAPAGWHVPTDAEWDTLSAYLGGDNVGGGALKSVGTIFWKSPNKGATNSSGFFALPGGYRSHNSSIGFGGVREYGNWWSATEYYVSYACQRYLSCYEDCIYRYYYYKNSGFSARLVKDNVTSPVLSLPSNEAINVSLTPTLKWNTVCGAATYCVQVSTSSTFATTVINDSTIIEGSKTISAVLNYGFKYYWRVNAKNAAGTSSWSSVWSFTTSASSGGSNVTVTDVDGNVYHTVTIGTQTWTIENLRTMHYNDGSAIPLVKDSLTWRTLATAGYCWYHNDSATYKTTYGALYNWYAVNTGKLAPAGWHVPTSAEWETLMNYLIAHGYNYDETTDSNKIAKAIAAQTSWSASTNTGAIGNNLAANNVSGFTALPGGDRSNHGYFGDFTFIGDIGYWWSATECDVSNAYGCDIIYSGYSCYKSNYSKICGNAVRLVKDN